jgi:DNA-binding response OmpR family regulator
LLREHTDTAHIPVIMLTAKTGPQNATAGLESGADDYVAKPFHLSELKLRIKAVLRRAAPAEDEEPITVGPLRLWPSQYEAQVYGKPVSLTVSEFLVVQCLAQTPGRVWSRSQIIDRVQGEGHIVTDRVVDVRIVSIRKKLKKAGRLIQTVRGVGYKIKDE